LATEPSPHRAYRAACPHCGAPVEFRSAATPVAVCSYCRSTLVRDGATLRRIGESAELFDDHSPLQLGASGTYQGAAFTLLGRLQVRYDGGSWNEWHALFESADGHRSGWLSEDNGQYVFAFDVALADEVPPLASLRAGAPLSIAGQTWSIASVVRAQVAAAAGELPFAPQLQSAYAVVDLRNARGEVATLEQVGNGAPRLSIGRSVTLADLAMSGLLEQASEKTLAAGGLQCPNCGAPLLPKLTTTLSMSCTQCQAVVDVSKGAGADLAHYVQSTPHIDGGEPQIPLGTVGSLALGGPTTTWQVVGYVERAEVPESADDEQVYWREYLLYNRNLGFAFVVDAEDGWSWTRPITGVPQTLGEQVKYEGMPYRLLYNYTGLVTYVLGEFYWQLRRDERTSNTDYQGSGAHRRKRLNREMSGNEIVWSAGETMDADDVIKAFRLPESKRAALQRDVSALAASTGSGAAWGIGRVMLMFFAVALMMVLFSRCGSDDCDELRQTFGESSNEYQQCKRSGASSGRTGGSSYGGFSSGGGHK
jgi:uncharacterized protein (DUF983 family)